MKRLPDDSLLIVGPGAMGLLFAARLQRAGMKIGLLDHCAARAKRLHRIRLEENGGAYVAPVACSANPQMAASYTHLLICVKAHTTAQVAASLAPHLRTDTRLLSLQNGLGNREALAELPCRDHVRIGSTSYGAYLVEEMTTQAAGNGRIQLGGESDDAICLEWQRFLRQAGFLVEITNNIDEMLWTKLILNAAINPVTALFGLRNGDLPHAPEAWNTACALLQESVAVANALDIHMDFQKAMDKLRAVCAATGENRSSMLVDLQAGKSTEVAYINGAIVRTGEQAGIPTPQNEAIIRQIHARESSQSRTALS